MGQPLLYGCPMPKPLVTKEEDVRRWLADGIYKPEPGGTKPTPNKTRWVGYLRVSTTNQAEDGQGLDIQADQIRAAVKEMGDHLIGFYVDAGVSGKASELGKRTGWWALIAHHRTVAADGVIVARLDRLAREFTLQEFLLADLQRKQNLRLSSALASERELLDHPESDIQRKLFRQIIGIIAEYERATIAQRMAHGRARSRARRGYGGGVVPYGKRVNADGDLEINPYESEILGIALGLRQANASWNCIAGYLKVSGLRPRYAEAWNRANTMKVIQRAIQAGLKVRPLNAVAKDLLEVDEQTEAARYTRPHGTARATVGRGDGWKLPGKA